MCGSRIAKTSSTSSRPRRTGRGSTSLRGTARALVTPPRISAPRDFHSVQTPKTTSARNRKTTQRSVPKSPKNGDGSVKELVMPWVGAVELPDGPVITSSTASPARQIEQAAHDRALEELAHHAARPSRSPSMPVGRNSRTSTRMPNATTSM